MNSNDLITPLHGENQPPSRQSTARRWLLEEWSVRAWRVACAALLGIVGVAVYLAQLVGSQFFADDFLYLQLARNADVTPRWFLIDNFGHFAPITRLAYLVQQRLFGLDYAVAAVVPAVLAVSIVLAVLLISRRLVGRRAGALALGLLVGQSMLIVRLAMWWGASMHVMGAATAYMGALVGFVAYCQSKKYRYQVLSVLFLIVALLVQERPLIIIGYLVLIRYLFRCGIGWTDSLPRAIRKDLLFWLPYVVVVAGYLWYRLFNFPSSPMPNDLSNAWVLLLSSVGRSFLPALAGLTTTGQDDVGLVTLPTILGLLLLIAAFVLLAALRKSSWRVLFFVVATYLANIGILALGRQLSDPIGYSRDLQYYLDPFLALILGFALGFGCLPRSERTFNDAVVRRTLTVVVVLGALVTAANVTTWFQMIGKNLQTPANAYFNRAEPELRDFPSSFDLLRYRMPVEIAPDFIVPYDEEPGAFSLDPVIAGKMDEGSPTKVGVLPDGSVAQVSPITIAKVPVTDANTTALNGAQVSYGAGGTCISGPPGAALKVNLGTSVNLTGLFFGIRYSSADPQQLKVLTQYENSEVGYNWNNTPLPAATDGIEFDRLDGQRVTDLILLFEQGVSEICVSDLWFGQTGIDRTTGCSVLGLRAQEVTRLERCQESWSALFTN